VNIFSFIVFQLTSNCDDVKMSREMKTVLIILSGVLVVMGESELFEKINVEMLSVNHQTAQLAWDTK
jgi:hypothetical protein